MPNNPAPVVSVIIVNWNGEGLIERCLHDLYHAGNEIPFEVIVIDNASSDKSPDVIRERFPDVRLVVNAENHGFGMGNNQGMQLARGKYYLLLNSDAFVHPGALDEMVRLIESQTDIGAVGCKLLYEDGAIQRSCYSFPTLATELWSSLWLDRMFPASRIFGKYELRFWDMDDVREVDSIMGACMLLRRTAIDQIGMFDDLFFMYSEEVDLCYRLKRAGWKIFYTPQAVATHIWGGSAQQVKLKSFLQLYRSRVLFFRKHYGAVQAALYKIVLAFSSLLRTFGGTISGALGKEHDKARAQAYGKLFMELWAF